MSVNLQLGVVTKVPAKLSACTQKSIELSKYLKIPIKLGKVTKISTELQVTTAKLLSLSVGEAT